MSDDRNNPAGRFGIYVQDKSFGPYGYIALVFDTKGNMIGLHPLR